MSRRGHGDGDGSLFQRKKDGKIVDGWIAEISLGPGAGRETFYAKGGARLGTG